MIGHVATTRTYYAVFAALMVLLVLTVAATRVNMGIFNTVVMVSIAVAKALLVVLYFMHVRWSSKLTWVFAGAGLLWLITLLGLTLTDYLSRGWRL